MIGNTRGYNVVKQEYRNQKRLNLKETSRRLQMKVAEIIVQNNKALYLSCDTLCAYNDRKKGRRDLVMLNNSKL